MEREHDQLRKLRVGLALILYAHGLFGGIMLLSRPPAEPVSASAAAERMVAGVIPAATAR